VKIKGSGNATKLTQRQAQKLRIKNELKFLYIKKQHINKLLYEAHLINAQFWQNYWPIIENDINQGLNEESNIHYNKIKNKIINLGQQQLDKTQQCMERKFYPRVHNMTNIHFKDNEYDLLSRGIKYNMGTQPKNCVKQLIYETENAIKHINDNGQQEAIRYIASKNIELITSQHYKINTFHKQQIMVTKQIKLKVIQHNAILAEADKGKTLVIIYKCDMDAKIKNFIDNNNISELKTDPTQKFHNTMLSKLKLCSTILNPQTKKFVHQMNPQAPKMRATIKIHKPEAPIRPVINNTNAPTHKLARYIHKKLTPLINLKYEYNVVNTIHFANNISKLKLNPNCKIITLDIKDLYVNIPIIDTLYIINSLLKQNRTDEKSKKEIMLLVDMIMNQNYFHYNGKFYKPRSGVAMGSPLSGLMAEIFLQDIEQKKIKPLLEDNIIAYYNRYVDDLFIIYNPLLISPQDLLQQFNKQHKNLQFTLNEEINNQITYLDLNLTNKNGNIIMEIYRKPTFSDITIDSRSCHPQEQKLATYKNWLHRLIKLPLEKPAIDSELNTIINIATNNGYTEEIIIRLYNKIKQKTSILNNVDNNKEIKWVSFTYTGNYIRKITKLFRNTNLKISFKTQHTLGKLISETPDTNKFDLSGIYKLTCQTCQKAYIGQTGRKLSIRYNEHMRSIRSNKNDSAYASHVLNNRHEYGPISSIMELLETSRKGTLMNIKEDFYIYYHNQHNQLIDEQRQNREANIHHCLFDLAARHMNTPFTNR
jgi:hypothetical protein